MHEVKKGQRALCRRKLYVDPYIFKYISVLTNACWTSTYVWIFQWICKNNKCTSQFKIYVSFDNQRQDDY